MRNHINQLSISFDYVHKIHPRGSSKPKVTAVLPKTIDM